jgi:hypothetical protein
MAASLIDRPGELLAAVRQLGREFANVDASVLDQPEPKDPGCG